MFPALAIPLSLSLYQSSKHAIKHSEDPIPLASSKLGNAQVQAGDPSAAGYKVILTPLSQS